MAKGQRGQYSIKIGAANKKAIHDYFKVFPDATQEACAKILGVTRQTVAKYQKEIKADREVSE